MSIGERKWVSYDLEFYPLAVELDGPDLEVNADSGDKGRCPCVVAKPKQQAGLSNTFGWVKECTNGDDIKRTRVSNQQELAPLCQVFLVGLGSQKERTLMRKS
jgi:hypothetical protein